MLQWSAARGLTDYVYAPKDDPKHRSDWRVPYDRTELAGFRSLVDESGLRIGIAISPGLSMDETSRTRPRRAPRQARAARRPRRRAHRAVRRRPATRPRRVPRHSGVKPTRRSRPGCDDRLGDHVLLSLVPTDYIGTRRSPYLDALAGALPDDVTIGWTGASVVNDEITADDARARADALGGRAPLLWDNVPVNDAVMRDRLFMGPLRGRSPELRALCSGYLANPMVQPKASMLPLASIAGWCAWRRPDDGMEVGSRRARLARVRGVVRWRRPATPRRASSSVKPTGRRGPLPPTRCSRGSPRRVDAKRRGSKPKRSRGSTRPRAEATLAMHAVRLFRRTRPSFEHVGSNRWRAKALDADTVLARSFGVAVGVATCATRGALRVRPTPRGSPRVASDLDGGMGVAGRRDRGGRERDRRPRAAGTRRGSEDRPGRTARDLRGQKRGRLRSGRFVRGGARERRAGSTGEHAQPTAAVSEDVQSPGRGSRAARKNTRTCWARSSSASGSSGSRSMRPSRNERSLK